MMIPRISGYTPLRNSQSFGKRNEETVHCEPVPGKFYTQEEIDNELNYWINKVKELQQEIESNFYSENGSHAKAHREAVKIARKWRNLELKQSLAHPNVKNKEVFPQSV